MNRFLMVVALLLLGAGCASGKSAQQGDEPMAGSGSPPMQQVQQAEGTLALGTDGTWALVTEDGQPLPIEPTERTQYVGPHGEPVPFTQFTAGKEIRASYTMNESGIAELQRVQIMEAPATDEQRGTSEPGNDELEQSPEGEMEEPAEEFGY